MENISEKNTLKNISVSNLFGKCLEKLKERIGEKTPMYEGE